MSYRDVCPECQLRHEREHQEFLRLHEGRKAAEELQARADAAMRRARQFAGFAVLFSVFSVYVSIVALLRYLGRHE